MSAVVDGLVWIISRCYAVCHNYWAAILIFTFITKIILLPLSVWVQKNSIKSVKMQPELNHIQAEFMGNKDLISEEQYKLFKREGYNPFIDLVPLFVQLALLMGVVEAVKRGTSLTDIPIQVMGASLIIPALAALSSWFMCYVQNKINVLQSEQGALNQYGTMIFSVCLSLYLGFFVSVGVGFYWTCSNILSVIQLFILNIWINPKHYIDYDALEKSKEELSQAKQFMSEKKKESRNNPYRGREKADYKKFMSAPYKKIVFYSEKNGFYKYYKNIIEEIIRRTNIVIHYITNDPEDEVFAMESEQFKPYYIGENRLIILMMKLECDICVMTTPDLENFHIKRSYVKKDIEYIYVPHDVNSANMSFHKNALDHYDTIYTSGYKNKNEIAEREKKYNLPVKKLVEWGSSVIDNMAAAYEGMRGVSETSETADSEKTAEVAMKLTPTILIAPSWQKDNILDLCIEQILDALKGENYNIIVRPHPQYVRHFEGKLDALAAKYEEYGITFQKDFSSNKTVYTADILVTDWSSIAYEYAFSTLRPVLFIDTPMKVINPDFRELTTVPIDIELRTKVGISVKTDEKSLSDIPQAVKKLLENNIFSRDAIAGLRDEYIYNFGKSGQVGAKYIIDRLVEISEK